MSMQTSLPSSIFPSAPVSLSTGGPLVAVYDCEDCNESHPNPNFLRFTDIPPEIIERVIRNVANPIDLHRLSRLCTKFKALAMYVMYGRISTVLQGFGFDNPSEFLIHMRRNGIYWAGPSLLHILFPDFNCDTYDNRLELHVPNNERVLQSLTTFLQSSSYTMANFYDGHRAVETFASGTLEYPYFGRTVKRIMRFTRLFYGIRKEIIVFVSKSEITGFLSITEYPTTLFMVYVDGINLHVLYPYLTGNRRGLTNLPFPQSPSHITPSFILLLSPSFDLRACLVEWPEYRFHLCEHNPNCPLRLRHQLDNRSASIGCSLDHPDMRPYRR